MVGATQQEGGGLVQEEGLETGSVRFQDPSSVQMDAQMQGEEEDRVQQAREVQSWFLGRMRMAYQAPS